MADTTLNESVKTLLSGLDGFVSSKTVVGSPVNINGTTVLPLMEVSIGVGAGALGGTRSNSTAGGMGAKMTPNAVLILNQDGSARLVNIKNQDSFSRAVEMVPDIIDKLKELRSGKNPDVEKTVDEVRKSAYRTQDLKAEDFAE